MCTRTFRGYCEISAAVHLRRRGFAPAFGQHLHAVRVELGDGGHQIVDRFLARLVNGVREILGVLSAKRIDIVNIKHAHLGRTHVIRTGARCLGIGRSDIGRRPYL